MAFLVSDMSSGNDQTVIRRTGRSAIGGTLALSISFYALLAFQLMRSMRIDAYELTGTRIDILGYWLALSISFLLGLRMLRQGLLQLMPLFLILFLIFYVALIQTMTAPSQSLLGFFVSRHGVMMWFVIGIGIGGMFDVFQNARRMQADRLAKLTFIGVAGFIGTLLVIFALQYLAFPLSTPSYQSVSSSAAIFLIMTLGSIEALWGSKKPMLITMAYLALGTILTAAVVRMQSTSIAALWAGLVVVFFWRQFWDNRLFTKLTLTIALVGGLVYLTQTEAFEDITTNTRFAEFFEGGGVGDFSSVINRIAILDSFADQFAISPIWGNFQAEILSGAGPGNYVHSVPLSFLTHTGLVGTALFSLSLVFLLKKRLFSHPEIDPAERQFGLVMLVVLILGTISTFLTWPLLWFMMGVLCRRPATVFKRK